MPRKNENTLQRFEIICTYKKFLGCALIPIASSVLIKCFKHVHHVIPVGNFSHIFEINKNGWLKLIKMLKIDKMINVKMGC